MPEKFAVIDTETNWDGEVMSVGIVLAEDGVFEAVAARYIIIPEAALAGGMYAGALLLRGQKPELCRRSRAAGAIPEYLLENGVTDLFAYNAGFDARCLPELRGFCWHDILKMAAYRRYNPAIPDAAPCYGTGRLKSGYRVEDILRMFGEKRYTETHNALTDAVDELRIMKYLGHPVRMYQTMRRPLANSPELG